MAKVGTKKSNNSVMTDDEYIISGREIKENLMRNEKISSEFKILEELYQDSLFDLKVLEQKNDIFSQKYQELKSKVDELTTKLNQKAREEEHRKKYEGNDIKVEIKADRSKALKNAEERFKKEGTKIIGDFMKQFE